MEHPFAPAGVLADASVLALAKLDNGVRVVVFRMPHLATAAVGAFVRSGSQQESARQNGIRHFIKHMAFKGTRSRDCQQINLDAERLGARRSSPCRRAWRPSPSRRPRRIVQQHCALAFEFHFGKGAVADDVAQHADERLGVAREAAHLECRVVLVGVGVPTA